MTAERPAQLPLGARVVDRDDPDPDVAVVVNRPPKTAAEWDVDGERTVASDASNEAYPDDASVVVVVFEPALTEIRPEYDGADPISLSALADARVPFYAFPAPRLAPLDDGDGNDTDEIGSDSATEPDERRDGPDADTPASDDELEPDGGRPLPPAAGGRSDQSDAGPDVPPGQQCTMCDRRAVDPTRTGALCPEHQPTPDRDTDDTPKTADTADRPGEKPDSPGANPGGNVGETSPATGEQSGLAADAVRPTGDEYGDADFTAPEQAPLPDVLDERQQWMTRKHGEKTPFAPWTDPDAAVECNHGDHDEPTTCDECEHSARYKWGDATNYRDGATAREWVEKDPRLAGRVFLQQESDPGAFVDGDDVQDPETGYIHPGFRALLEHLGATYTDVSTSGTGVHAYYRAPDGLPLDGKNQATFEIDTEPWGANDDPPTVEIYANRHVCVTTAAHVPNTPRDVREWNADALRAVLEANGYDDREAVAHDTDRERADLEGYEPDATAADDTTDDIRDVLAAVDDLGPRDLSLRTRQTGSDSTGWEQWDPSTYRQSSGGDSLHTPDREVFHDHKEGEAFGVLKLFALERGILSRAGERLAGADWWEAVDAARDAGAPIPEYNGGDDTDPVAVLPPAVRDLTTAASGWDWKHAAQSADAVDDDPLQPARDRTSEEISDVLESFDHALVEALPTLGKSYGAVKAVAETGEPATILTNRGNVEQYAQYKKWADLFGLDVCILPSFTRDCDTANGEHGEDWAETVQDWYTRGATPQDIHAHAEYHLGRPLPCQEHEGECPYTSRWRFDPDDYDILLGHYSHAYNESEKVTVGRAVILDEYPRGAYERAVGGGILKPAVTQFLQARDAIPYEDYTDLLEHRDDDARRADALAELADGELDADPDAVFQDSAAHADAPLAVFTILAAAENDLGNGLERAAFPGDDDRVGVFDRAGEFAYDDDDTGGVRVLDPPSLEYARSVVALDGTPTPEMWELSLGERLNHRRVLTDAERREYVRDKLNLNIVRTTEHVKPYNSADHVAVDRDMALLDGVRERHGQAPGLITTQTALDEYEQAEALEYDDDTGDVTAGPADRAKWYGDVLGSNEFGDTRLGVVIGSNHYGDGYLKKWGAYAGESVERTAVDDDAPAKGDNLTYGDFGDRVHRHMVEHDTLQGAMRFGRDGNGSVVYCHTDTLPEWVPIAGEGRVLDTWSDGERQVLDAAEELTEFGTGDLADHPTVEIGERQVFNILTDLADRDVLDCESHGRGYRWTEDGLDAVPEHGEVALPTTDDGALDVAALDDETVQEISRNSNYTWNFPNSAAAGGDAAPNGGEAAGAVVDGADRPPDPGD